jgi:hypothetical protein
MKTLVKELNFFSKNSDTELPPQANSDMEKSHYEEAVEIIDSLLKKSAKDLYDRKLASFDENPLLNTFNEAWDALQEYLATNPLVDKVELLHRFMDKAHSAANASAARLAFDYYKIMIELLFKYRAAFLQVEVTIDDALKYMLGCINECPEDNGMLPEFKKFLKHPLVSEELKSQYLDDPEITELFEVEDSSAEENILEEKEAAIENVVEDMAVDGNQPAAANILPEEAPVPLEMHVEEPDVPFLKRSTSVDIGVIEKRRKLYF